MTYKKFKLVYGAEGRDIKGSLSGIPAKEDPTIVTLKNYDAKLVYERPAKKAEDISELKASLTGIPADGDRVIGTRKELEGIEEPAPAKVEAKAKKEVIVEEAKPVEEKVVAKSSKKATAK